MSRSVPNRPERFAVVSGLFGLLPGLLEEVVEVRLARGFAFLGSFEP